MDEHLICFVILCFVLNTVNGNTTPCKDSKCCRFSESRYQSPKRVNQNCYTGKGHDFRGKQNISWDGKVCMNWRDEGSQFWGDRSRRSRYGIGNHNYCRNPDSYDGGGPWCYVDFGLFSRCGIIECTDYEYEPTHTTCDRNKAEFIYPDVMYSFGGNVFYITKTQTSYDIYKFQDVNMTSLGEPPRQTIKAAFNLCTNNQNHDIMTFATSYDDNKLFLYFERPNRMVKIVFTPELSWMVVDRKIHDNCTSIAKLEEDAATFTSIRQFYSMNEPDVVFLLTNDLMIRCEWKDEFLTFINSTKSPFGSCPNSSLYFSDRQDTHYQLENPSTKLNRLSLSTLPDAPIHAIDQYPVLAYPFLEYDHLNTKSLVKLRIIGEINSENICKIDGKSSRMYQLYDGNHLDDIIRWLYHSSGRQAWLRIHDVTIRKTSFCDTVENISCCKEIAHQIMDFEIKVNFTVENNDECKNADFLIFCLISENNFACPSVLCHGDRTGIHTKEAVICEIPMENDPPCSISLNDILKISSNGYHDAGEAVKKMDDVAASIKYQDKNDTKVLSTLLGFVHALEKVNYTTLSRSVAEELISDIVYVVDNIVDDDRVDVWKNLREEEQIEETQDDRVVEDKLTTSTQSPYTVKPEDKMKKSSPTDMLFTIESILAEIVSGQSWNPDQDDSSDFTMEFKTKNIISVIQKLRVDNPKLDVDRNFLKFDCPTAEQGKHPITIVSKYPKLMHLISQVENSKNDQDCIDEKCLSKTGNTIEYVNNSPIISASLLKDGKKISSGVTFIIPYTIHDIPDPKQRDLKFYFSCRYLAENDKTSQWDESGCRVSKVDHILQQVHCTCNHTTNFAILLQVVPPKIGKKDMATLQVISYVGESISVICLLITLTTFIVFRNSLKSARMVAHFHLVVALLTFHSTQLMVSVAEKEKNSNPVPCIIVTLLTHFSLLASFCWMLCEGLLLHMSVISVFHSMKYMKVLRYVIGWVFPFIISGITILYGLTRHPYPTCYLEGVGDMTCPDITDDSYSNSSNTDAQPNIQLIEWCWLSSSNYLIWTMAAPAIITVLANTVVLIRVSWVIAQTSKSTNMYRPTTEQKKDQHIRKCLKGALILMPILGIPWIFGFIPQAVSHVGLLYAFTVLNSLQGLFIMLFYCVWSSEVRSAINRCARRRNLLHTQNWSTNSSARHTFGEYKSGSRRSFAELIKTDSKSKLKINVTSKRSENKFVLHESLNNNVPGKSQIVESAF